MDRHGAYRKRCKEDGKCPHCGKPCAPFTECEERRNYKAKLRSQKTRFTRPNWPDKMKQPRGPRRLWTPQEDYQLAAEMMKNTSFKTICDLLNRSPWGVIARARKLGLGKFNELQPLLHVLSMGT